MSTADEMRILMREREAALRYLVAGFQREVDRLLVQYMDRVRADWLLVQPPFPERGE